MKVRVPPPEGARVCTHERVRAAAAFPRVGAHRPIGPLAVLKAQPVRSPARARACPCVFLRRGNAGAGARVRVYNVDANIMIMIMMIIIIIIIIIINLF